MVVGSPRGQRGGTRKSASPMDYSSGSSDTDTPEPRTDKFGRLERVAKSRTPPRRRDRSRERRKKSRSPVRRRSPPRRAERRRRTPTPEYKNHKNRSPPPRKRRSPTPDSRHHRRRRSSPEHRKRSPSPVPVKKRSRDSQYAHYIDSPRSPPPPKRWSPDRSRGPPRGSCFDQRVEQPRRSRTRSQTPEKKPFIKKESVPFMARNADPQKAAYTEWRREKRAAITERGDITLWGLSPKPEHFKDSEEEEEEKKEKKKKKKKEKKSKKAKKKAKKRKKRKATEGSEDEDSASESGEEWVEQTKDTVEAEKAEEEKDFIGPKIPTQEENAETAEQRRDFGKDLLPGEGAAMAAYIADGKRIPRRGEIGLTSDDINVYEEVGYVMSGTRHRRMEATRLRKESQIYSAEEKRMLGNFSKEQRDKKETVILSQFKSLINKKMNQQ